MSENAVIERELEDPFRGDTDGDLTPPLVSAAEVGEPPLLVESPGCALALHDRMSGTEIMQALKFLQGEILTAHELRAAEYRLITGAIKQLREDQEKLRDQNRKLFARCDELQREREAWEKKQAQRPPASGKPELIPELPVLGPKYGRVQVDGHWVSLNCNGQSVDAVREYLQQKAA